MKRLLALIFFCSVSPIYGELPAPASLAYLLQADSFAETRAECVRRLAESGRDWIVLDAFFQAGEPWTSADLDAIRRGRPGRRVIAYLSIGEAEDYRPYWRPEWRSKKSLPNWIGSENPEWKGNWRVKYWNPEWQKIILSAGDEVMARGFDGVYLDIVDGFQTFEQGKDGYRDNRLNPETRQSYRRDMVDWVKVLAARVRTRNPDAIVIPQNGSELLEYDDFLKTITAMGIEDLFTEGDAISSRAHTATVLKFLDRLTRVGKPVLLVEYPQTVRLQTLVRQKAQENGWVFLLTDRDLKTLGFSQK